MDSPQAVSVPQLLLGADSTVSAAADYAIPQCWSLALHDAFPKADGILYMSRHISTKTAAAIFERAKTKDPVIGKNNYFGANVNRAARIEPVTAP